VAISVVDLLGEDLVLLSIRPDKGDLATGWIDYGLSASELVRLAARGRIDIQADHVVVRDGTPVGDAELDAALDSLVQAKQPPKPKNWIVGGWTYKGRHVVTTYLGRLASAGVLRSERRRIAGTRWLITDPARVADARGRLDAIALSPGQVDVAQAAFGGLAHPMGSPALCRAGERVPGGGVLPVILRRARPADRRTSGCSRSRRASGPSKRSRTQPPLTRLRPRRRRR